MSLGCDAQRLSELPRAQEEPRGPQTHPELVVLLHFLFSCGKQMIHDVMLDSHHRKLWVGRDLKGPLVPAPLPWAEAPPRTR